ncbi:MAG TPA: trigger factor [Chloroflexia bacterium]|nr:trigger factor [Chloroflexia bacterium]
MNITREDMPGRQVALTIELEPEMINGALDRAYRQMVNQVNVPGFRRGKAPRSILESYIGTEMLTERAVKNILPQTVQDAITAENIEAMDVGDVEIVNTDPLQVRVVIVQPPKVELGDYGSIRVEKKPIETTTEQVDEVLTELRREGAPWNEPAEPRPIREGDMVYINLEGFTTEGPMAEATRDNFPTLVGAHYGGVPEVVNQALTGMSVGEEKDITETLPDDYPTEALRGKDASYHVTVLSMKEQELPELNDEFAKTLGEYETVDALRESVEKNLRQRAEEATESNQLNQVIHELVSTSTVEVPEVMVKEELDLMLKKLEERLKEQRLSLRQYLMYNGITEDDWRQANRQRAEERLARGLTLQEFASREGISVDDSEIEGEIDSMLERFDQDDDKEKARTTLSGKDMRHGLEDRLYQRKILDQLIGIAEGRIEAAPKPAEDEQPQLSAGDENVADNENESDATALEEAGGAAEVLGTDGVDTDSPYETGEAEGGGTPSDAPRLETKSEG